MFKQVYLYYGLFFAVIDFLFQQTKHNCHSVFIPEDTIKREEFADENEEHDNDGKVLFLLYIIFLYYLRNI